MPLDGSPNSERIVPYARSFAEAFHSSVELMHVIHPDTIRAYIDVERGRRNDVVQSDLIKAGEEYLSRVARSFPDSAGVHRAVEVGRPRKNL